MAEGSLKDKELDSFVPVCAPAGEGVAGGADVLPEAGTGAGAAGVEVAADEGAGVDGAAAEVAGFEGAALGYGMSGLLLRRVRAFNPPFASCRR